MHGHPSVTISSTARQYPRGPYAAIAADIVGHNYQLTLTFVGAVRARSLNRTYRKKNYVPNVLSFPLSASVGEIFITPVVARREAAKHGLSYRGYVHYLFIHGLLHLKGYDHGATMSALEAQYKRKYAVA
jgi:rRNA maturation RNase YbeY